MSSDMNEGEFVMRAPCKMGCQCIYGIITETNGQNCVRCASCDAYQYNAPKTETGQATRSVSTTHKLIKPKQRARILQRAGRACEICHTTDKPLHVGHKLSVEDGHGLGLTDERINSDDNLMALCEECNLGMGSDTIPLWLAVSIIKARKAG